MSRLSWCHVLDRCPMPLLFIFLASVSGQTVTKCSPGNPLTCDCRATELKQVYKIFASSALSITNEGLIFRAKQGSNKNYITYWFQIGVGWKSQVFLVQNTIRRFGLQQLKTSRRHAFPSAQLSVGAGVSGSGLLQLHIFIFDNPMLPQDCEQFNCECTVNRFHKEVMINCSARNLTTAPLEVRFAVLY